MAYSSRNLIGLAFVWIAGALGASGAPAHAQAPLPSDACLRAWRVLTGEDPFLHEAKTTWIRDRSLDSRRNDHEIAADFLLEELKARGLDPKFEEHSVGAQRRHYSPPGAKEGWIKAALKPRPRTLRNIVVRIDPPRGTPPGRAILVGAHYDTVNSEFHEWFGPRPRLPIGTPGANDNASGIVGVLELIDAIRSRPISSPVVAVFFDGEETGIYGGLAGSTAFAKARGEELLNDYKVALVLDMIGAPAEADPLAFNIAARHWSEGEARAIRESIAPFQGVQPIVRLATEPGFIGDATDTIPFGNRGLRTLAVSTLIHTGQRPPNYHNAEDRFDQVSPAFLKSIVLRMESLIREVMDPLP